MVLLALQPGDVLCLKHFASMRKTKNAVELGTFLGDGTSILAPYVEKITTIDIFEDTSLIVNEVWRKFYTDYYNEHPHSYEIVKKLLSKFRNVNVVRGLTFETAKTFEDNSVDFLFIDADHSYEGCKQDFDFWFPKIMRGGLILIHDCEPSHPGPYKFSTELKSNKLIKELSPRPGSSITTWEKI